MQNPVVVDVSDPYVPETGYRGISANTLNKVGAYFTRAGENETVHWPYPSGVKHRTLPKSIKSSGKMDHFFGQDDYDGGKVITITEGEEDRCSVIEMMGDYPTVSLPGATPSSKFWESASKYLANFQKIVLSIEDDVPGNKVAKQIYDMFPGKVYRVNHGKHKDANEYLMAEDHGGYRSAWWNAARLKPDTILGTKDDFVNLFHNTPEFEYFETGIPGLDEKMLGIHKGAFTVILAETGIGKTEFFRYLEWQCFNNKDKYKFAFNHGEESQLRSILGLYSYHKGHNYTRKELVEQAGLTEDFEQFAEFITEEERVYQWSIRVDEGSDDIVNTIRFLAVALEVDFIFLEPIQDFISASNTSEKESLLTDITNKLKRLAVELNVGIVVIAHSNKEGEAKYAASIVQGAAYEIRLQRDADNPDKEEANKTYVSVGRKNRTGGGSGLAGALTFDHDKFTLEVIQGPVEMPQKDE